MKKLFQSGLTAAMLLMLAVSAWGQSAPEYNYLFKPLPWGFATVATNATATSSAMTNGTSFNTTNASVVTTNFYYTSVRNFQEVEVTVSFAMDKANSAGTANTTTFQYTTAPSTTNFANVANANYAFTVAHNGTNVVYFSTNIYVGSAGFFAGRTAVNNNTNSSMTGFTNTLSFKGNRYGQR